MKTPLTLILLGLLTVVHAGVAQTLPGDVLYSTDFTGPNGSSPEDWTGVVFADLMDINSNRYRFRRNDSESSASFRSSVYDGAGASDWDNYQINTRFETNHIANYVGVIGRWDGTFPEGNNTVVGGYLGYIYTSGTFSELRLSAGFQQSANQGLSTILAQAELETQLSTNTVYELELVMEGPQLTLSLYTAVGGLIASISAVDHTYSSGNAGLASYFGYWQRQTFFHDFEVTSQIPEAATFGLIGGVLLLGGTVVVRRRRCA